MAKLNGTSCCGLNELANIQTHTDPISVLMTVTPQVLRQNRSFLIYSCNDQSKMGDELSALIKENGLGVVKHTRRKHNPNSGNKLRVYLWDVEAEALRNWYEVNKPFEYSIGDYVRIRSTSNPLNAHIIGKEGTVIQAVGQGITVAFRQPVRLISNQGNEMMKREYQFHPDSLEYIPV